MANDLIIALRRKRMEGMGQPDSKDGEQSGGSDMSDYWEKIQGMDDKLEQIMQALGISKGGDTPGIPDKQPITGNPGIGMNKGGY